MVDVSVSNRRPSRISASETADPSSGVGGEYDAHEAAGVVITLRNAASSVSVVTRVRFTVVRYAELTADGCIPGAGPIAISANYQVRLPAHGHVHDVIDVKVSQELRPQTGDRMRLGLALNNPSQLAVFDNGDGTGASRLYVLRIDLMHDGDKKPLHAGEVLVAVPFPYIGLLDSQKLPLGLSGDCISSNRATLAGMLSSKAVRSPELDEL